MSSLQRFRAAAIAAVAVLLVTSCGDDDDGGASGTTAAGDRRRQRRPPRPEGAETTARATRPRRRKVARPPRQARPPKAATRRRSRPARATSTPSTARAQRRSRPPWTPPPTRHWRPTTACEPFVIGIANLEGDPAGTFPDVREGAEAAVQLINERLGGIGADVEAGTGGRPIELAYCGHLVDQNEAQACANQLADANPNMIIPGVDFFTPLMYPLFTDFPVVEMLPIFIADFDQPGVYGIFGGCVTAFPSSAELIAEVKGHDRLAVIWSENAPGTECWRDTHERFYQYYADTLDNFAFQGFPYTPGDQATIRAGGPADRRLPGRRREPGGAPRRPGHRLRCPDPGPAGGRCRGADLHHRGLRQRGHPGAARVRGHRLRGPGLHRRAARALRRVHPVRAGGARGGHRRLRSRDSEDGIRAPDVLVDRLRLPDRQPSPRRRRGHRRSRGAARGHRRHRQLPPARLPADLVRREHRRSTNRSATARPVTPSGTGRASPSTRTCRTAWTSPSCSLRSRRRCPGSERSVALPRCRMAAGGRVSIDERATVAVPTSTSAT